MINDWCNFGILEVAGILSPNKKSYEIINNKQEMLQGFSYPVALPMVY